MIMHALIGEGGFSRDEIAFRLVSFGDDGVNIFQSPKSRGTTQIRTLEEIHVFFDMPSFFMTDFFGHLF